MRILRTRVFLMPQFKNSTILSVTVVDQGSRIDFFKLDHFLPKELLYLQRPNLGFEPQKNAGKENYSNIQTRKLQIVPASFAPYHAGIARS